MTRLKVCGGGRRLNGAVVKCADTFQRHVTTTKTFPVQSPNKSNILQLKQQKQQWNVWSSTWYLTSHLCNPTRCHKLLMNGYRGTVEHRPSRCDQLLKHGYIKRYTEIIFHYIYYMCVLLLLLIFCIIIYQIFTVPFSFVLSNPEWLYLLGCQLWFK